MEAIYNYISIMIEGLEKKVAILTKISKLNALQKEIAEAQRPQMEKFDEVVEEKGRIVDELVALDDGFEQVYNRVREQLTGNKDAYAEQIRRMKELITQITELSVKVQSEEARNREIVAAMFTRVKQSASETRKNSQAVTNYYKTMSRVESTPQFLDKKK